MGQRKTMEMISRHPSEAVLGVQVTGNRSDQVARAVARLDELGFDTIDINMGCPVRKIVGSGSGCAFLLEPDRMSETVAASRAATAKPLSVKTRVGFDERACTIEDSARRVVAGGADMFTIHGRYRSDTYAVGVRREAMSMGFAGVPSTIAKIGNGDVMDFTSARLTVEQTGCDGVMVSRGALGNPWIFSELLAGQRVVPTLAEWEDTVLRHIQYHEEFHGDHVLSARRIRKHLIWYASGFPKSNRERARFNLVDSMGEAREMVKSFARTLPRDLHRYENPDRPRSCVDPKFQMDRTADAAVATQD
jgi:nifR3 family TIM-barrel protein